MKNINWVVEEVHLETCTNLLTGESIIYYWFDEETPNSEYWNRI